MVRDISSVVTIPAGNNDDLFPPTIQQLYAKYEKKMKKQT